MKIYSFYTASHRILKEEWLVPSLRDEFECVIREGEQKCETGAYKTGGWAISTRDKVDLIIEAIQDNWDGIFLFSDVDIQFFRPAREALLRSLGDADMAVQRDAPYGMICSGFFVCRCNQRTLNLWKEARDTIDGKSNKDDQDALNELLINGQNQRIRFWFRIRARLLQLIGNKNAWYDYLPKLRNRHGVQWTYLPEQFLSGGTITGRNWEPGMEFPIPENIIMHHANWCVHRGVEGKIAQLTHVRNLVEQQMKQTGELPE